MQHWLDEAHDGLELPVSKGVTTVAGLEKAEELLAYYCRHRHNDWSAAWIRKHLKKAKPALYPGWVEDLVNLCRSHHEGLEALQQSRFHARYRGSPAQVVNLRYLAALLRVADVLEFDPERTPNVIIAHRDIAPNSRIFWYKDRFSFLIDREMREFRLDAITPNASVHRAVLETVQQVDHELLTCNALASSGAFRLGSFEDKRCSWPWPAKLNAKASEDGTFVYIDGAFRPEPQHILKLLGGVELYRDAMVAVRELLQNALDAVKEQIARERLRLDNPGDVDWEQRLGGLHKVTLSVVEAEDGVWLACEDDGVGMTRAIIERHLMVSGAPTLPEVHQLERQANACGFSVERSGRFGIGVLAYFMLADRMVLDTRRSELAGGDPANTAWRFEIDGLASFGQLTTSNRGASGTNVRLLLKQDQLPAGLDQWVSRLLGYVASTLVHSPCRVQLDLPARENVSLGPGWCRQPVALLPSTLASFAPRPRRDQGRWRLVPAAEQSRRQEQEQARRTLLANARDRLRWHGPIHGRLPENSGCFRLTVAYFEYPQGVSLAYLNAGPRSWRKIDDAHGVGLKSLVKHSWRGFEVEPSKDLLSRALKGNFGALLEVDWCFGVDISVDRSSIEPVNPALVWKCSEFVLSFLQESLKRFLASRSGIFFNLNEIIVYGLDPTHGRAWISEENRQYGEFDLVRMQLPSLMLNAGWPVLNSATWIDQPVSIWHTLRLKDGEMSVTTMTPSAVEGSKALVFFYSRENVLPLVLIKHIEDRRNDVECNIDYPPDWSSIIGIEANYQRFLNRFHGLCTLCGEHEARWVESYVKDGDPTGMEESISAEIGRVAAWVLANLFRGDLFWEGIIDHCGTFLAHVLQSLHSYEVALPLRWIRWGAHDVRGYVISAQGLRSEVTTNNASMQRIHFPDGFSLALPSGEEWWVRTGGQD